MTILVASGDARRPPPPTSALERRPGLARLPSPTTTLIGRADDLLTVVDLLRREAVRLLTVTGPAGVGKTRFALSAAAAVRGRFGDGVAWVPLAAVTDPAGMVAAISRAIGVAESSRETPAEGLGIALRDARLLLVLDNFEQLLAAAPTLAELLVACPHLAALVTSRGRLRVSGEQVFPLAPLAVPAVGTPPRPNLVAASPAVELFVARARSVVPGFALSETTAPPVADICRRLDGLPLAIELAAGRVGHLDVATLADRLERRLPVLTGGASDVPDRHRTLRDAIAWSHDLLTAVERSVLRRVSVFADGFTLDAAEAVVAQPRVRRPGDASAAPPLLAAAAGPSVLDVLSSLVDKSLVRYLPESSAGPRYTLLETIREFAAEQLSASGEEVATRSRHAHWFLAFAEAHEVFFNIPHREPHLTLLSADWSNLPVAFDWFDADGSAALRLRLAECLYQFAYLTGRSLTVRSWLEHALEPSADVSMALRGRSLIGLAFLKQYEGGEALADADRLATEGLTLLRPVATPAQLHVSLITAGLVAAFLDDDDRADGFFREALAVARTIPDPVRATTATADALDCLGDIAHSRGQTEAAVGLAEQALALYRGVGDV